MTAAIECFSFFAAIIRCTRNPPPPGSAPGYQMLHQVIANGTMMNAIRSSVLPQEAGESFQLSSGDAANLPIIPPMPPTSGRFTAKKAAAIAPTIARKNSRKSVKITPRKPPIEVKSTVAAIA